MLQRISWRETEGRGERKTKKEKHRDPNSDGAKVFY